MEPTPQPVAKGQSRVIWPLLKARVVSRTDTEVKLAIGGSTTITVSHDMRLYDLKEGDLLTLYTEVLLAKPQGSS